MKERTGSSEGEGKVAALLCAAKSFRMPSEDKTNSHHAKTRAATLQPTLATVFSFVGES